MGPESQRERVAGGVVPAGVLGQPPGLGHHVAVEEDENLAGGLPGAGVAGPGQTEAPVLLVDDADVERAGGRRLQRRTRPVVHDHHLEQLPRVGLALESSQGQLQRLRRLVVGDDDRHEHLGLEAVRGGHRQLTPVVAPHTRRRHAAVVHASASLRPGSGRTGEAHRHGDRPAAVITRKSPAEARGSSSAPSGR